MKKLLAISIFVLFYSGIFAQKSFGNVIVGLESGFDVAQFSKGLKARMSPALQAEVSLGPVSLGVGIGRKFYRDYDFYTFTGETTERMVNGVTQMYYLADQHSFKPAYWTVPLKINYRVHRCDCVYLHVGVTFENVDLGGRPDVIKFKGAEFEPQYYSPALMNLQRGYFVVPKTKSYEFGIGFNVFRRDFFRLTARPTYVLTENPDVFSDGPKLLPTLRFTFAAQFAIWRVEED